MPKNLKAIFVFLIAWAVVFLVPVLIYSFIFWTIPAFSWGIRLWLVISLLSLVSVTVNESDILELWE